MLLLNDNWTLLDRMRMPLWADASGANALDLQEALRHAQAMARPSPAQMPPDLRLRLEAARLDLLALFRALDQMDLTPAEIPQRLIRQLFELDADYVDALWALDQPVGKLDLHAMARDTLAALEQLPHTCGQFRKRLPSRAHPALATLEALVRSRLNPTEAYNMVPGRDPQNG
jgi:hypothetical protein